MWAKRHVVIFNAIKRKVNRDRNTDWNNQRIGLS